MKKILLLGDSIRQNYQEYVKEQLKEKADVFYPRDNGRFCAFTLRYLHDYVRIFTQEDHRNFDVIHFNFGLWDILRLSNEDRTFTSEQEYADLLIRLCNRMNYLCPKAKLIFALTTSVIEPGFEPGELVGKRLNKDIKRFNEIAKQTLEKRVDAINDLWETANQLPLMAHSDDVHFETAMGIKALGQKVVDIITTYIE